MALNELSATAHVSSYSLTRTEKNRVTAFINISLLRQPEILLAFLITKSHFFGSYMYTITRNWFPRVDVSLPLNLREKKREGKINILKNIIGIMGEV